MEYICISCEPNQKQNLINELELLIKKGILVSYQNLDKVDDNLPNFDDCQMPADNDIIVKIDDNGTCW